MSASSRQLFRPAAALLTPLLLSFAFLALNQPTLHAQGTHLWTQSQLSEFEKGTPQGVELTSDGHLRQGPGLTPLLTTPSTFVWSVAVDKSGTAFLGTGSPASVLRVGKDNKPFPLFKTKDLTVQVVRFGPDGALYAATLPSGKIYKLNPNATQTQTDENATVVFDAGKLAATSTSQDEGKASSRAHYIWDLTFDRAGRMYIAAGGPGAVYRIDPSKPGSTAETFFKTDEAHIRSLAWDGKGNLIAGSDGTGLVYRINPEGKGYVLFDSPRREVTSLAVAPDGTIYAACVGDKGQNPLPPLPVQGVGTVTITVVQPGSLGAANQSTSIPGGSEIYALAEGRAPRKVWAGKDEIVYALAERKDGLLALSGNRGRLFLIQDDGEYADVGHLDAQQGLSLAADGANVLIGTGNTGKLVRLGTSATTHEYASDVLDTGNFASFGRVEVEPGSSGYALYTRTGNIDQPARGWNDWQALKDGVVASPAGRFLQWKVELQPGGNLGSVGVNYLPASTAPVVDNLVVVPGAKLNQQSTVSSPQSITISFPSAGQSNVSFDSSASNSVSAVKDRTAVTAHWSAHDDDGDNLIYALYLRGDGETVWRLLKDKISDTAYSFDATRIPDGGYQLKVVASDAPSEPPADVLTGDKVSDRFVVDTTPPVISNLKTAAEATRCTNAPCPRSIEVTLDAQDATSPIAHAEYSVDAGPWTYVDPVGKISDSQQERYDFKVTVDGKGAKPAEHLITVRVYDRYENVAVAKTVVRAQE
ncbi:MAG: hypothetical protein ACLGPM_03245 [Acidobacteriota bacterium]